MALPTSPLQILTILNPARRKALHTLLVEITRWMRRRIELDGSTSPQLIRLRSAALAHFDSWRRETLAKAKEVLSREDDDGVIAERRRRVTERGLEGREGNLINFGEDGQSQGQGESHTESQHRGRSLHDIYPPVATRLATIPYQDREETLSCVLLLLLSAGKYPAESRTLAVCLASALDLPVEVLDRGEYEVARLLLDESERVSKQGLSAGAEAQKRRQENQASRFLKVGLASVAGAALIGVTGGLAAPVVAGAIGGLMGTVGLGGVASFLGIFLMNPALVGTLFGALGARMTGEMVDQYAKEVEDFRFIPIRGELKDAAQDRRLRVTIGINGWLDSKDDVVKPWRFIGSDSEVFALQYEMNSLVGLGESLRNLVTSSTWNFVKVEILKRTVLATLWSALWPAYLLSMAASVDNPFSLARNRSEKSGKILADALINKVQGERPVTLVGYSLGARVIYSCLRSLVERRAFGLVDSVVMIGAPVPSNRDHWMMMRSVVSGTMFNVHSENDYLLAFIYRATSVQLGVAGLQEIDHVDGVVNLDLSDCVHGHLRYPELIDRILAQCGFPMEEGAATGPIVRDDDEILSQPMSPMSRHAESLIELDNLPSSQSRATPTEPLTDPLGQLQISQPASPSRPRQQKPRSAVLQPTLSVTDDPLSAFTSPAHTASLAQSPKRPSASLPSPSSHTRAPHPITTGSPPAEPPHVKYLGMGMAQDLVATSRPEISQPGDTQSRISQPETSFPTSPPPLTTHTANRQTSSAPPTTHILNRQTPSTSPQAFTLPSSSPLQSPSTFTSTSASTTTPTATSHSVFHQHAASTSMTGGDFNFDSDDDEGGGFVITMVDNESNDDDGSDLSHLEPTPIED